MNTERIDELIANRGARPNLSIEDWQKFIELALKQLGADACYRFCLYPHSRVPAKELFAGFPGRIADGLKYLNILELVVVAEEPRECLVAFLDEHGCPYEVTTQFNPDTGADEPIGLRVYGYSAPSDEANPAPKQKGHNKPW